MKRALLFAVLASCGGGKAVKKHHREDRAPIHTAPVADHAAPITMTEWPAGTGDYGGPGPTLPIAVGRDGTWMALCQAREDTDKNGKLEVNFGYHGDYYGDLLTPYLIRGGGLGGEIGSVVAVTPDERYAAIETQVSGRYRDGFVLQLYDARTGTLGPLPIPDRRGLRTLGGDLELVFTPDSARAVYFRPHAHPNSNQGASIVIRELATGREREVVLPRGIPFYLDPRDATWVKVTVVERDEDRNGLLELPRAHTDLVGGMCHGPAAVSSTWGHDGDKPTSSFWLRVDTGELFSDDREPGSSYGDNECGPDGEPCIDHPAIEASTGFVERYLSGHLVVAPESTGAYYYDTRGNQLESNGPDAGFPLMRGPLRWVPVRSISKPAPQGSGKSGP